MHSDEYDGGIWVRYINNCQRQGLRQGREGEVPVTGTVEREEGMPHYG